MRRWVPRSGSAGRLMTVMPGEARCLGTGAHGTAADGRSNLCGGRRTVWLLSACVILAAFSCPAVAEDSGADMLHGTETHFQLFQRFEETTDWRLLRFLMGRAGLQGARDVQRVQGLAAASRQQAPETLRLALKRAGIIWDRDSLFEARREAWSQRLDDRQMLELRHEHVQLLGAAEHEEILRRLHRAIPMVQRLHRDYMPFPQEVERPLQIRVYPSRSLYDAQDFRPGSYATYRPGRAKIAFWVDGAALAADREAELVRMVQVLCHEMWHFYIQYHAPGMPVWMEEGMAEVFESALVQGDEPLRIGPQIINATNQAALRRNLAAGFRIALNELMHFDTRQFTLHGQVAYPQAWSVTHWLMFTREQPQRDVIPRLIHALRRGHSTTEAVRYAIEEADWECIEAGWEAALGEQQKAPPRPAESAPSPKPARSPRSTACR